MYDTLLYAFRLLMVILTPVVGQIRHVQQQIGYQWFVGSVIGLPGQTSLANHPDGPRQVNVPVYGGKVYFIRTVITLVEHMPQQVSANGLQWHVRLKLAESSVLLFLLPFALERLQEILSKHWANINNHIVSVFVAYDFEHLYRSNENTNPNKRIPVTLVYSIYFSETILNHCAPLLRSK
jgi:hypothetical protein